MFVLTFLCSPRIEYLCTRALRADLLLKLAAWTMDGSNQTQLSLQVDAFCKLSKPGVSKRLGLRASSYYCI